MIRESIFTDGDLSRIRERVDEVKQAVRDNLLLLPGDTVPIPIAGACYKGIWMEHDQDWFFLADLFPESAWRAVELFMEKQKENGLFPAVVKLDGKACYRQIQSVWPFTGCAFQIAKKLGKGEKELLAVYRAGAAFDRWLGEFRDHQDLGLVEMFCEFDSGHDNSPRVKDGGLPHNSADGAESMPSVPCLPILAPDLSAMRYEGRTALSEIASLLGNGSDAAYWLEQARKTRDSIEKYLYDAEDDYYYDVDPSGSFRKYRTEHLTRLYLNNVVDQRTFDRQYKRYFENEEEFCTPYPYPSVSITDPSFVKTLPANCWGGNTQALTSLRALLWLERYGRTDEKERLLKRWMRAFLDHNSSFTQELDPFTGAPIGVGNNYMPSLILFLEGAKTILK